MGASEKYLRTGMNKCLIALSIAVILVVCIAIAATTQPFLPSCTSNDTFSEVSVTENGIEGIMRLSKTVVQPGENVDITWEIRDFSEDPIGFLFYFIVYSENGEELGSFPMVYAERGIVFGKPGLNDFGRWFTTLDPAQTYSQIKKWAQMIFCGFRMVSDDLSEIIEHHLGPGTYFLEGRLSYSDLEVSGFPRKG